MCTIFNAPENISLCLLSFLYPTIAHAVNSPLSWVVPPLPVTGTVERIA